MQKAAQNRAVYLRHLCPALAFHKDAWIIMAKVTCPKCKGTGSVISFAIPKEDFEKGLSGYALYSSNKLNAKLGCSECGGYGIEYEAWFKVESPEEIKDETKIVLGTGEIDEN